MATFCLRPVENFHLTYDHEERCYKLKALPVDGKPFYYRARVDEAFSIVPKLLCSTFVQELVFVDVVLSDGLCKSIRDIGHTTRIGKLQVTVVRKVTYGHRASEFSYDISRTNKMQRLIKKKLTVRNPDTE